MDHAALTIMPRTWFVTGCGRGLGRAIARAALERGDHVVATSRRHSDVADLADSYADRVLPFPLDIRDRTAAPAALAAAVERFGTIDILVNNAARSLIAAVEEATEAEVRDLIETNLLGTLWVTQAALPIMRAQGHGHIVQISSGGGVVSWPMNGIYQASKFGLEGMSEALAQETSHLGLKVTIVQVGHMESGFARPPAPDQPELEAYAQPRALLSDVAGRKGNDPDVLAGKLLEIVDDEDPPLRVLLGRPLQDIREAYESRLRTWSTWVSKLED